MNYQEFLESKRHRAIEIGFSVPPDELHPSLFDFQRYIVTKALNVGRYAIFADCGLGKTLMQLCWADIVSRHTAQPVLILAPLAVVGQTIKEGQKFGYLVNRDYTGMIHIANYDQIDNIDCSIYSGVVLDESSILKNYEGAIKTTIIERFQETQFKLACTATPSPNDPMELGNHSEFLNAMKRTEMLAMYFTHDGSETAKWMLKGHSIKLFWAWVSSWAVMLSKPSDIGFSASGYDLPALNYLEKKIITDKRNNGMLFNDIAVSATNFNSELRLTKIARMSEVVEIVNASAEPFIVWVKHNEEGETLRREIPGSVEVKGSDTREYKEEMLLGFGEGKFRVLITKLKVGSYGLNYQNCHNQVFASPDFSFEGLYQGIRRSYRFGQLFSVNIWLITTDTMANVITSIQRKQKQFEDMQRQMTIAINSENKHIPKIQRQHMKVEKKQYTIELGDCVELIKKVPDESIGFSMFSPPFASLYTYSDELEDMGNSKDYKEFLYAFGLLVKDLYRVLWSGRNVAVHCMDLPIQKGKEGYIGLRDFSGMIRQSFEEAGFIYHSRVTIWKNPVTEMQRTKALGLLHKQVRKDAAMSRVGLPDYLLVFRKPGEHMHPVKCDISVDMWQQYASPVWMDIDYGDTLNDRQGREPDDTKHVCPLQLPTIERATTLWSNEGDPCLTPFGGIGSEAFQWVKMNRKALAFELKKSYFEVAVKNLEYASQLKSQLQLF